MSAKVFLRVVVLLIAIGAGGFLWKRYNIPPQVDIPALALTDLHGQKVSLKTYEGHPLFLSFFATWCGPCIREMPELAGLKEALADKELAVICISDEPVEKLKQLEVANESKLTFLHSETSLHDIGVYTYPTNYIYDAKGRKVYNKVNPDKWTEPALIAQIRKSLN